MSPIKKVFLLIISVVVGVALTKLGLAACGIVVPWSLAIEVTILVALVLHKRVLYHPFAAQSKLALLFMSGLFYFLPATICWALIVVSVVKTMMPSAGGLWAQVVGLLGLLLLVQLLMENEIHGLGKK